MTSGPTNSPEAVTWGCARCGYSVAPSTMPPLKVRCPLCGGAWVVRPAVVALANKKAAKESVRNA